MAILQSNLQLKVPPFQQAARPRLPRFHQELLMTRQSQMRKEVLATATNGRYAVADGQDGKGATLTFRPADGRRVYEERIDLPKGVTVQLEQLTRTNAFLGIKALFVFHSQGKKFSIIEEDRQGNIHAMSSPFLYAAMESMHITPVFYLINANEPAGWCEQSGAQSMEDALSLRALHNPNP